MKVQRGFRRVKINRDVSFNTYRGEIGLAPGYINFTVPTSIQSAHAWAGRGYNAANPFRPEGNPTADAAETHEIIGQRNPGPARGLRGYARHWLNASLGISPAVGAGTQALTVDDQLRIRSQRIISRNGKWESKRIELMSKSNTTTSESSIAIWPFVTGWYPGVSENRTYISTTTSEDVWFTVQSRTDLPDIRITELEAHIKRRLYGFRPNLGVAWELVPYSWLIDYVIPVGSLIELAENRKFVSFRHACLMHKTEVKQRFTHVLKYMDEEGFPQTAVFTSSVTKTVKRRFAYIMPLPGVAFDSWTPVQLANAAALFAAKGAP
jgi:hypothetical protein